MSRVINFVRGLPSRSFVFDRPLVLLHSDDWGRVGVRDAEGFAELQAAGLALGENPYDFYTLETAEDVAALHDLLSQHHDSTGRSPSLAMNFLLANLDFPEMRQTGYGQIHLRWLRDGLPGRWSRPGLFEAYKAGIAAGVFYPAVHGLTHFCRRAAERALAHDDAQRTLLQTLWQAETPYIHWRMPWIGYEYCDPGSGVLPFEEQAELIECAVRGFTDFFSIDPVSACAPGYRANRDTRHAWAHSGLRVAQHGSDSWRAPHFDDFGLLNLYRTIDFEPAVHADFELDRCLKTAEESFARGLPAIVSIHSVNFHSSLKDFRGPTLAALDRFFSTLERRHADLLYVNDAELLEIIEHGQHHSVWGRVRVRVRQVAAPPRAAARGM